MTTRPAEVEPFARARDLPGHARKPDYRGGVGPGMGTRASSREQHADSRSIGDTVQRRRVKEAARSPTASAGAQRAGWARAGPSHRVCLGGGPWGGAWNARAPARPLALPAPRGRGLQRPHPRVSPEAGQLRPGARPRRLNGPAGSRPRKLLGTPGLRARRAAASKHR